MASTRRELEDTIRLSPRERRLADALLAKTNKDLVTNAHLCSVEFGHPKKWPINARQIITGAMNSLQRKLRYYHSEFVLVKHGNGGRAGIEYQLKTEKGTKR